MRTRTLLLSSILVGSLVLLLLLSSTTSVVATTATSSTSETTSTKDSSKKKQYKECGVYLAPSTIPGAGMGMFAGNKQYEKGDIVTEGDIVVPVFELDWHNGK